jgi:hypothetical protein
MYKIRVVYIPCDSKKTCSALLSCVECDHGTDNSIFRMPTKEEVYSPHLFIGPISNTDLLSDHIMATIDNAKQFVSRRRSLYGTAFNITI